MKIENMTNDEYNNLNNNMRIESMTNYNYNNFLIIYSNLNWHK